MFNKVTPEKAGIKSKYVKKFICRLEKRNVHMHSVILCRGTNIFGEFYWAPFTMDTPHRMYSQTKSYVSVAIGLLLDEGKLSLDDKIIDFFPEKSDTPHSENMKKQTVRDMLMMSTVGYGQSWFGKGAVDRAKLYFTRTGEVRCPATIWEYDSQGSQVLACLVEKLAGMPLFDYLNEKIFSHLGTFKNATILKTPTGESISAALSTTAVSRRVIFFFIMILLFRGLKGPVPHGPWSLLYSIHCKTCRFFCQLRAGFWQVFAWLLHVLDGLQAGILPAGAEY
jgi:CubicO group peptidase (beta-lactamase class C family)